MYGELGDDVLKGGLGDDYLDGGEGSDTIDYSSALSRVTVDMNARTAKGLDVGAALGRTGRLIKTLASA